MFEQKSNGFGQTSSSFKQTPITQPIFALHGWLSKRLMEWPHRVNRRVEQRGDHQEGNQKWCRLLTTIINNKLLYDPKLVI